MDYQLGLHYWGFIMINLQPEMTLSLPPHADQYTDRMETKQIFLKL